MTSPLFYPNGLMCESCGEPSPTSFMHQLNHHIDPDGVCTSARLRRRHEEVKGAILTM